MSQSTHSLPRDPPRDPPRDTGSSRNATLAFLVACAPFVWLVASFRWLCDDAFISFRYARHLASGFGLRFNLGDHQPVEGYTNFLWVLWASLFERLGLDTTFWIRLSSALCGVALLLVLARYLAERVSSRAWIVALGALFLATFPPIFVWSTGGLEPVPFALLLFIGYDRLSRGGASAGLAAGIALALATLLRADGVYFAGVIAAACGLSSWMRDGRRGLRPALVAGVLAALTFGLHVGWRYLYYGDFVPNTARAKIGFGPQVLERGGLYVTSFFLTFASVPLVLVAALGLVARPRGGAAFTAAVVAAGVFAYSILVGGDFMAMARFLVPVAPFLAVLFAAALERLVGAGSSSPARRGVAALFASTCIVLSLLPAFDRHIVPLAWREACQFRFGNPKYVSERGSWERMHEHAREWSEIGRALRLHTQSGESMSASGIGCFGYYSDLFLVDMLGLVVREEQPGDFVEDLSESAGHTRKMSPQFFQRLRPTYKGAHIFDADAVPAKSHRDAEMLLFPLREEDGFEPGRVLVLLKVLY